MDDGQDVHWDQISSSDGDPSNRGRSKRRRRTALIAAGAAVLVLAGAAAVGAEKGLLGDDETSSALGSGAVPSTSRALAAAVLAHVPESVEVVWATGYDLSALAAPMSSKMPDGVTSVILLRSGGHEYLVIAGAYDNGTSEGVNMTVPHRDARGRIDSENLFLMRGEEGLTILEIAGPGGAGHLPLSESELHEMANDPLVGTRTTRVMLAKARSLSSYQQNPPPLSWNPLGG